METSWLDREAWPWRPRWFDGGEGRLHYVDEGEARPVLMSHGTPTWSFEWRHLIRGLAPDRRVIAVDHLGFGLSDRPAEAGYAPEDHARRFSAFADHLDLRDVTVVVHDYGGPIALPWVLDHLDRVARLVVVNTWAWPLDDPRFVRPSRMLDGAVGRWLYGVANLSLSVIAPSAWADRRRWRAVADQYRAVFPDRESRVRVLWPLARALHGSRGFYASLESRLGELEGVPVDVVWGLADSAFTVEERDGWLARVPHARALNLADAGHWPHEEAPERIVAHLRAQ